MLKKIRCFYWKMRDQGKGRQVKLFAFVLCLAMVSMVGLIGKSIVTSQMNGHKAPAKKGVTAGAQTGATATSKGAVSMDATAEKGVPQQATNETPATENVDTSGLDSFLGFMSDNAYENMKNQVVLEGQKRRCSGVKKLNYQVTSEGTFDVTSFVLFSDGSIYQCDYNLKNEVVTVKQTVYSEADIQAMSEQAKKAEQEALEKQQQEDKKKADAAKKKKEKKSQKKKVTKTKSSNKK